MDYWLSGKMGRFIMQCKYLVGWRNIKVKSRKLLKNMRNANPVNIVLNEMRDFHS
jgi:hypothetical protein